MSWSAPTSADVLTQFLAAEKTKVDAIAGATTGLAAILGRVVAKVRGAVRSGGYALDADATKIPSDLFDECVAMTVWRFVNTGPSTALATEPRKLANESAEKKLEQVAASKYAPEPPTESAFPRSGNWNAENKILPRTHPVPRPGLQVTGTGDDYANPDGPADEA